MNKTKRPIFHFVLGIIFLASVLLYVFTEPNIRSRDRVSRDSHGADGPTRMTNKMAKLHSNNLVPLQQVQVNTTFNSFSFCMLFILEPILIYFRLFRIHKLILGKSENVALSAA